MISLWKDWGSFVRLSSLPGTHTYGSTWLRPYRSTADPGGCRQGTNGWVNSLFRLRCGSNFNLVFFKTRIKTYRHYLTDFDQVLRCQVVSLGHNEPTAAIIICQWNYSSIVRNHEFCQQVTIDVLIGVVFTEPIYRCTQDIRRQYL